MVEPARTTFAAWLDKRGETAYGFAKRLHVFKGTVYALAGVRSSQAPSYFKTETLERVSVETGIPVQRLYSDWSRVEPRAPRKYTRRQANGAVNR